MLPQQRELQQQLMNLNTAGKFWAKTLKELATRLRKLCTEYGEPTPADVEDFEKLITSLMVIPGRYPSVEDIKRQTDKIRELKRRGVRRRGDPPLC
jgi:hypothetical protein